MDASVFLAPFLAVFTTLTLDAVRKVSSSQEQRIKKMQHCITRFDAGSRTGIPIPQDIQIICRQDLDSVDDEIRNHNNAFTGFLANIVTLTMFTAGVLFLNPWIQSFLDSITKAWQAQPHELIKEHLQGLWLASFLLQTLAACICWFWIR